MATPQRSSRMHSVSLRVPRSREANAGGRSMSDGIGTDYLGTVIFCGIKIRTNVGKSRATVRALVSRFAVDP